MPRCGNPRSGDFRHRVSALYLDDGIKTVNLAPADLKKEGPSFDLPIALAMIAASGTKPFNAEDCCVVGELGLDGAVRPVKGVLSIALEAKRCGRSRLFVPEANAPEAAVIEGIQVFSIRNLKQAWDFLNDDIIIPPFRLDRKAFFNSDGSYEVDFDEVKGQYQVKRALEVAAAGNHNLLMVGPPGTGKSMLAKRIATIMPGMTEDDAIETTKIHSVTGRLDSKRSFLTTRPFRSPHHTISDAGLLGGGTNPGPGEVSLAHHGVLFLDELPEFRRSTLEVLRQPFEDGVVTISRAVGSLTFPAQFMLVAAMNPCPCGYYGDSKRECRCSPRQIETTASGSPDRCWTGSTFTARCRSSISGSCPPTRTSANRRKPSASASIAARGIQLERFKKSSNSTNSSMGSRQVRQHCQLNAESSGYLEHAMEEMNFSARAHDRILKVARTLARSSRITGHPPERHLGGHPIPLAGPEVVFVRSSGFSVVNDASMRFESRHEFDHHPSHSLRRVCVSWHRIGLPNLVMDAKNADSRRSCLYR